MCLYERLIKLSKTADAAEFRSLLLGQKLIDGQAEIPAGERLLDEAGSALLQKFIDSCEALVSVTRVEEDFGVGIDRPDRMEDLAAAHLWHDHVQDHHSDVVPPFAK